MEGKTAIAAERDRSLLSFLNDFAALRRKRITKYKPDDKLLWFGKLPRDRDECRSPFLTETDYSRGLLLDVRKQPMPSRPQLPPEIEGWVREDNLDRWDEQPELINQKSIVVTQVIHQPDGRASAEQRPQTIWPCAEMWVGWVGPLLNPS